MFTEPEILRTNLSKEVLGMHLDEAIKNRRDLIKQFVQKQLQKDRMDDRTGGRRQITTQKEIIDELFQCLNISNG